MSFLQVDEPTEDAIFLDEPKNTGKAACMKVTG